MGGDIAAWCALRGLEVTLQDRELKYIEPALKRAAGLFEKRIKDPIERRAASERPACRRRWRRRARGRCRHRGDLRGSGGQARAVCGHRAAHARRCGAGQQHLEPDARVARAPPAGSGAAGRACISSIRWRRCRWSRSSMRANTRPEPLGAAMAFTRRIDKLPVPCKSGPGFLVNRVLFPYLHEALHAAGEGIDLGADRQGRGRFRHADGPDRAGRCGRPRCDAACRARS